MSKRLNGMSKRTNGMSKHPMGCKKITKNDVCYSENYVRAAEKETVIERNA